MTSDRLKLVASGDYLHTMGRNTPAQLGFGAYDALAHAIDLRLLDSAPQTDAVPASGLVDADGLLMFGQACPRRRSRRRPIGSRSSRVPASAPTRSMPRRCRQSG
jgi:hypothetical protein